MKILALSVTLLTAISLLLAMPVNAREPAPILLESSNLRIVFSDTESVPLKIALEAFKRDFVAVMGTEPSVVSEMDGFESHRI